MKPDTVNPVEAVVGLEIHVQLNCPTKLFCDCPNAPAEEPNRHVCPICLGLPGTVPRFSRAALERAALTGLALNCQIQPLSAFDQKVYYYPDLPKGYQLSQHHLPLARNGWLEIAGEDGRPRRLRIHHIHMEEDVAKLVHETEGRTKIGLVDFNRAGAPLVEIVTEPDLRSPYEAMEFLKGLRAQIRCAGTAECSMESGSMRCDANISIRAPGSDEMNAKVEVKNMNSVRAVGSAIAHEVARQSALVRQGRAVTVHTRLWDPDRNITAPMREKFAGPCIPDPVVPPIRAAEEWIEDLQRRLPEMPGPKRERLVREYGLTGDEAAQMSEDRETGDYFEALARAAGIPARTAAQWVASRLLPALKERGESPDRTAMTPARLAELLMMAEADRVSATAAREVFYLMLTSGRTATELVEEHGFAQIDEAGELEELIRGVMADHPAAVQDLRNGKDQAAGFLIGQAMRMSKGKANPMMLREILERQV